MSVNVYATNHPNNGYEFQGSFDSIIEFNTSRFNEYEYVWADDGYHGDRPVWVTYQAEY